MSFMNHRIGRLMNGFASEATMNDFCEKHTTTSNCRPLRATLRIIDNTAGTARTMLRRPPSLRPSRAEDGMAHTETLMACLRKISSSDPCWNNMTSARSRVAWHRSIIFSSAPPGSPTWVRNKTRPGSRIGHLVTRWESACQSGYRRRRFTRPVGDQRGESEADEHPGIEPHLTRMHAAH